MKDVDSPARVRGTRIEQWVPDVSVGKERRGIKKNRARHRDVTHALP